MRCIIAGSRTITDWQLVAAAVAASGFRVTEVTSGGARGVDLIGERWARARGIRVRRFPAQWDLYGRSAGMRRNLSMARDAAAAPEGGCLVAVWDGVSRGTGHMIDLARQHGLAVYVHRVPAGAAPHLAGR